MLKGIQFTFLPILGLILNAAATAADPPQDTCEAEPTDMAIDYGDYHICSIAPTGDGDYYRFFAAEGDSFSVNVVDLLEDSFRPSLRIVGPSGQELYEAWDYRGLTAVITAVEEEGVHSAYVKDIGDDYPGQYSIELNCIGGQCPPMPGSPAVYDPDNGILSIPEVQVRGTTRAYEVELQKRAGEWVFDLLRASPLGLGEPGR